MIKQLMNGYFCNDCTVKGGSSILINDYENICFNIFIFATQINDPQSYKMLMYIILNCSLHEVENSISLHMDFFI